MKETWLRVFVREAYLGAFALPLAEFADAPEVEGASEVCPTLAAAEVLARASARTGLEDAAELEDASEDCSTLAAAEVCATLPAGMGASA